MTAPPIAFTYLGQGHFKTPSEHWARLADRHYGQGEVVRLVQQEQRSTVSHNHYYACLAEAHANLPDELAVQYPSPDHLRRYALIRCGYADSHVITCSSETEARKVANFIRPIDEFSVVTVKGNIVTRFTAQSQSYRAMNKETFQRSKDQVLGFISEMIGTTKEELAKHIGKSGEGRR